MKRVDVLKPSATVDGKDRQKLQDLVLLFKEIVQGGLFAVRDPAY